MSRMDATIPMPPRKNWFNRNWWWFLPLVIGLPLLLIVSFIGGIILLVFTMITSSQPYQDAVSMARQNTQVQQILGTPIEEGWLVMGNIETSGLGANSSGMADLSIPIYGPASEGSLYVYATKQAGQWTMHEVTLHYGPNGYNQLDLINPQPVAAPASPLPKSP